MFVLFVMFVFLGKEEMFVGQYLVYIMGFFFFILVVIFICDIFGYKIFLFWKFVDKVVVVGYFVVVFDIFKGDLFMGSYVVGDFFFWFVKYFLVGYLLEVVKGLVEVLKDKGIGFIGVVGFCYGVKIVVIFVKEKDVKCIVQCYFLFIYFFDYEEVVVFIVVFVVFMDGVEKYEGILVFCIDVKSFVKIFFDVQYGWIVWYDEINEIVVEQVNEVYKFMIDWFVKYLQFC